jgi:hypothetical protein
VLFVKCNNILGYVVLSVDDLFQQACNKVNRRLILLLFVIAVYISNCDVLVGEGLLDMIDDDRAVVYRKLGKHSMKRG